jgi:hypothetical protein
MTPERLGAYRKLFAATSTADLRALAEGRKPHNLGDEGTEAMRLVLEERKASGHVDVPPPGLPTIRHESPQAPHRPVVKPPSVRAKSDPLTDKPPPTKQGMFEESNYIPFVLGVFIIGGLIIIPYEYGFGVGPHFGYFERLPWSLASCAAFLIAFRRNGTTSWVRMLLAFVGMVVLANREYPG